MAAARELIHATTHLAVSEGDTAIVQSQQTSILATLPKLMNALNALAEHTEDATSKYRLGQMGFALENSVQGLMK